MFENTAIKYGTSASGTGYAYTNEANMNSTMLSLDDVQEWKEELNTGPSGSCHPEELLVEPDASSFMMNNTVEPDPSTIPHHHLHDLGAGLKEKKIEEKVKAAEKKPSYYCDYCSKEIKTESNLIIHRRIHTGEKPFKCDEPNCEKLFTSNASLKMHKANCHITERHHICSHCNKAYKTSTQLKTHLSRIHAGEKNYHCQYCEYSAYDKTALDTHIRKHHTKTFLHVCDICGKGFFSNFSYNAHRSLHEGVMPFCCKNCGEKFPTYSRFQAHKNKFHRIPNTPTSFTCTDCGKFYKRKKTLKIHIQRDHEGMRFECYECGRCVSTKESIILHLRTHTGERPYKCKICKKRFISRSVLKNHLVVHTKEKNYVCNICNKKYSQKSTLTAHNKKLHPELAKAAKIEKVEKVEKVEKIDYADVIMKSQHLLV